MKKLMITLVAVAMGFAAQANAIKWGVSAVNPPTGCEASTSYTAYLFMASDSSGAITDLYTVNGVTAKLKSGDLSVLDNAVHSFGASKVTSTGTMNWNNTTIPGLTHDTGATLGAFAIILDDEEGHYLVAQKSGESVLTSTVLSGSTSYSFAFASQAANNNWIAIPEPTSGLLMLLGMAGLALRRRRA